MGQIYVNLNVMMARRGISAGELADRIGITPANLSILKNNKARAIRFSTLEALCRELNCQPAELLEYREDSASAKSFKEGSENDMDNSAMNTNRSNASGTCLFISALASYPIAYFYIRVLLFHENFGTPGIPIPAALLFTVIFMAAVEIVSRTARHESAGRTSREHLFWGAILAAQGAALAIHGMHSGSLGIWQICLWHLTAIYYTAVCTDMLTAGRTSIFLPMDMLTQMFAVPAVNVLLRIKSLIKGITRPFRAKHKVSLPIILSIAVAVCVVLFAWSQLAAADRNFGQIGSSFFSGMGRLFRLLFHGRRTPELLLSIPVGCYLFAMVCGSLVIRGRRLKVSEDSFRENMEPMRRVPAFSAGIVIGALTIIYVIFFSLQAAELILILTRGGNSGQVLSAPSASEFAVNGFHELCRILILNFCILGFFGFFLDTGHGRKQNPLRRRGALHLLTGIFSLSGIGFALLAIKFMCIFACTGLRRGECCLSGLWQRCWLSVYWLLSGCSESIVQFRLLYL